HCRHGDNVGPKIEVTYHAADDHQLLKILFTKQSDVRRKNIEQFSDDGANAAKMSGSRFALQRFCKSRFLHRHGPVLSVHLRNTWTKQEIHAGISTEFFVFLLQTWIPIIVTPGFKLQWIYKNTYRDLAPVSGMFPGDTDQFPVRSVQGTHGRNKDTRLIFHR